MAQSLSNPNTVLSALRGGVAPTALGVPHGVLH